MDRVDKLIRKLRDGNSYVREAAASALNKIYEHQVPLLKSYPNLLCEVCHLRAEEERIRVGLFKKKRHVFCRICKSLIHLITDIEEVIGIIGGNIGDYKRDGKVFYVNLWDEETFCRENKDADETSEDCKKFKRWFISLLPRDEGKEHQCKKEK